jgi:hypothetical protein
MPLPIKQGIDALPVAMIPDNPTAFVTWFKNSFLAKWASNADVRNATQGPGISITGNALTAATLSISEDFQSLLAQPYVLVGSPVGSVGLTDYRSIATQANVLSLTDGGSEGALTIGVVANGIGNTQIRQSAAASVVGNAGAAPSNVSDISASADGQVLLRQAGSLSFGALPVTDLAAIASNTVVGNIAGTAQAPVALTQAQLTALINLSTTVASGAMPPLTGSTSVFLNGNGAFSAPAIPTAGNPTSKIGLTTVNGTATTWMRSDAAPQLDVTIAPTWTGNHTFTPGSSFTKINALSGQRGLQIAMGSSSDVGLEILDPGTNGTDFRLNTNNTGVVIQALASASNPANLTLQVTGGVALTLASTKSATFASTLGINGNTPPAQVTGWGTPTSPAVVANFSGTAATNAQVLSALAQIITTLKAFGLFGA